MSKIISVLLMIIIIMSATASSNGYSAINAIDNNNISAWNSGGFSPQWIEVDLGEIRVISTIKLLPLQSPGGYTYHTIYAGISQNPQVKVCSIAGLSYDNQWISCRFSAVLARYIRVVTTQSPSWVAWREIKIIDSIENVNPIHKIGVDSNRFIDTVTGLDYIPLGYNYVRLDSGMFHNLFTTGYNYIQIDKDLSMISRLGYNTIRVFAFSLEIDDGLGGYKPGYIDNFRNFLQIASNHGLHVIVVFRDLPASWISINNCSIMSSVTNRVIFCPSIIQDRIGFIEDFISKVDSDVILGYDIQNEYRYITNEPPFTFTGNYIAPNGISYNLDNPPERQQMMDAVMVYWIDTNIQSIHSMYPSVLLGISFFSPVLAPINWSVRPGPALALSSADFFSLHDYPSPSRPVSQDFLAFEIQSAHTKPMILGEVGFLKSSYSTLPLSNLQLVKLESDAYNMTGMFMWTWNTTEQVPIFWTGIDGLIIDK